ncbi:hypothetical protein BC833DRAFT_625708, partial [Globomyces pollinis-pini]
PPSYTNQVDKHCRALFNVKGCTGLVNVDFYIKSCITDATLTGSFVFSESARLAFMTACHTTTQCMTQDVDPVVVQKAVTIQKECGLGNNTCINKCSGKGVCGNNGCRCEPGFGGVDCSISLTTLITYNPVSQQYAPNTDAYLLPVKQEYPADVAPIVLPGYSSALVADQKIVANPNYVPESVNPSVPAPGYPASESPVEVSKPNTQSEAKPQDGYTIASSASGSTVGLVIVTLFSLLV